MEGFKNQNPTITSFQPFLCKMWSAQGPSGCYINYSDQPDHKLIFNYHRDSIGHCKKDMQCMCKKSHTGPVHDLSHPKIQKVEKK